MTTNLKTVCKKLGESFTKTSFRVIFKKNKPYSANFGKLKMSWQLKRRLLCIETFKQQIFAKL